MTQTGIWTAGASAALAALFNPVVAAVPVVAATPIVAVAPIVAVDDAQPAPAIAPTAATPATPVAQADDASQDIALGTDSADRMTVAVGVDGKGPFRFVVDTGAERSAISDELATHLNLEKSGYRTVHSVAAEHQLQSVNITGLTINDRRIDVAGAPLLKRHNIGADGVLGIDGLTSQRVLFDFRRKIMSIVPTLVRLESDDKDAIVIVAKRRNGRLIFTDAIANGHDIVVVIDTGSEYSIGNPALARRLFGRGDGDAIDGQVETVTGETMSTKVAIIESVQFGPIEIKRIGVAFADAHIFHQLGLTERPTMLLGMNALRSFDRFSIDFATRKVRFVLPKTGLDDSRRLAAGSRPARPGR